jgi:alpha-N-arabinofuranosidase
VNTRSIVLLLAVVAISGCGDVAPGELAAAQRGGNSELQNPSFEQDGLSGWSQQGRNGRARIVRDPVATGAAALELSAQGKGASGADAFMVFQVLDASRYRGQRVRFGAKVRTDGAAVNITLYTPIRFESDFYQELRNGQYVERSKVFDVPREADFVSFGLQIMGPGGGRVYVDDAFAIIESEGRSTADRPRTSPPGDPAAAGATADVRIDATKPGHTWNPHLFGMHLEWAEAGNGVIERGTGRLRTEVIEAFRELKVPIFRFPGGIHADYYDWQSGARPRGERPNAENVFTKKPEPQLFGSPEFAELLKQTSAQAVITANYGTGRPEQAASWAQYFRDAGVQVPYWEVGNEIYLADPTKDQPNGKRISRPGRQYAQDFPKFRDAIRAVMPDAKVGLIAHVDNGAFPLAPNAQRQWTAEMLAALRSPADFVAVHNAYAPVIINDSNRFEDAGARARAYKAMYAAPQQTAEDLDAIANLVDRNAATRGLPIAITEWGPLFGYSGRPDMTAIYADQSRTMAAAVYTASVLDVMLGNPRVVMATYTNPVHKWYGSLLTDTDRGLVRTPSYHVFAMYRSRFEPRIVPVTTTTRSFASEAVGLIHAQQDAPEVVTRASLSADGRRLSVMLINRNLDAAVTTRLSVSGFAMGRVDCLVLSASSAAAINGSQLTRTTTTGATIRPQPASCAAGSPMSIVLPASSVTSVVAERK